MSIDQAQDALAQRFVAMQPQEIKPLSTTDPFIATSCLQKALRRGNAPVATSAAISLLRMDAGRLWRRLAIVSFEDFGLTDLGLTAAVVAASSDKRWRTAVGGDEHILRYLVNELTTRPRDRRVDNLYMLAVRLVRHPASRLQFLDSFPSELLLSLVQRATRIVERCEKEIPKRAFRAVLPRRCDEVLNKMLAAGGIEQSLYEVCLHGRRIAACLLPLMLPLVKHGTEKIGERSTVSSVTPPEVSWIGDLPSYAIDGFTRLGREALFQLADTDADLRQTVKHLHGRAKAEALTYLLFDVEGGICTSELDDPFARELKSYALGCWTGLPQGAVRGAMEAMRAAIPRLNAIRQVLGREAIPRPSSLGKQKEKQQ